MRLLVIEDQPEISRHICTALAAAGHEVAACHDGVSGLKQALATQPDLIVLDVQLPGMDGFSVLEQLRARHCSSRVIILTAQGSMEHRLRGLQSGADDYLGKPFVMDELLARVGLLTHRAAATRAPVDVLKHADLVLEVASRRVTRGGERIEVSPREFDLLRILMSEPGRTFSRDEICERIWEREHQHDTRTVEIFIMRLRKKLDFGGRSTLIQTVRGTGYRLQQPA